MLEIYFTDTKTPPAAKGIPADQVLRNFSFKESFVGNKLYVGNLSYSVGDAELQQLFSPYGTVSSAQVIADRDTGRSKGFGFVEMGSDQEASAAASALNGTENDGRSLTVNEAKPRTERGSRGGFGGGGRRDRW